MKEFIIVIIVRNFYASYLYIKLKINDIFFQLFTNVLPTLYHSCVVRNTFTLCIEVI